MSKLFPVVVKRITEIVGGGGINASRTVIPAFVVSLFNTGSPAKPAVNPAFSVAQKAESTLLVDEKPAFDIDLIGATGTGVNQVVNPALRQTTLITGVQLQSDAPAAEIVQVTYSLVRRVGANAQAAVGTAWTNPGNATGAQSGAPHATCVGSVGGNTNGIELSYLDHVLKGELTITEARLFVYMSVVDLAVPLCTHTISYNIGGGLVTLRSEATANGFNALTTPLEFVLPITTWTQFNALQTRVVCVFAVASATVNASLDAIEIRMTANKTDAL